MERRQRTSQGSVSISAAGASDTGLVRDENEDAYGHFSPRGEGDGLFIVADGMGGHTRGREASTTTIDVVRDAYFGQASPDGAPLDALASAFEQANETVYQTPTGDEQSTMGTTATALVLRAGHGYVAHVGDSRLYRFTGDGTQQLTTDHTIVEALRREGTITDEEAKTHPRRGTLTRAIGAEPTVEVDTFEIDPPEPGDRFLLCSDGLEDIPTSVLREVVLENAPREACEGLIRRANERGGHDNATALVVHVK